MGYEGFKQKIPAPSNVPKDCSRPCHPLSSTSDFTPLDPANGACIACSSILHKAMSIRSVDPFDPKAGLARSCLDGPRWKASTAEWRNAEFGFRLSAREPRG